MTLQVPSQVSVMIAQAAGAVADYGERIPEERWIRTERRASRLHVEFIYMSLDFEEMWRCLGKRQCSLLATNRRGFSSTA